MQLETRSGNPIGKARWRVPSDDGKWSRTLDDIVLVLLNQPRKSTPVVHNLRLQMRARAGDRLNSDSVGISQLQTEQDLAAALEVSVVEAPAGLWRISAAWLAGLDAESVRAIQAFSDCF